jgi:hypothetical protein
MKALMDGIRAAILSDSYEAHAAAILGGASPYAGAVAPAS